MTKISPPDPIAEYKMHSAVGIICLKRSVRSLHTRQQN